MSISRIYQITRERLDDDDELPTGTPTINVAQDRQKLKVVGDTDSESINQNEVFATADTQDILLTSSVVQEGDDNPVTSDAVATALKDTADTIEKEIQDQLATSTTNDLTITPGSGTYSGVHSFYKRVNGNFIERWVRLNYTGPSCSAKVYTTLVTVNLPAGETLISFNGNYVNGAKHDISYTTGGEVRLYNFNDSDKFAPTDLYFYITSFKE